MEAQLGQGIEQLAQLRRSIEVAGQILEHQADTTIGGVR
jgi:hypothetical protein